MTTSAAPAITPPPPTQPGGVGGDVRALRKSRGMTLAETALQVGRSVGWLSQVERGLSEPTIDDLRRLSLAFDVPLSLLFGRPEAPEDERGVVVRANARRRLGDPANGLVEELLSPDLGGSFEIIRSVFAPGAESDLIVARPTEEAGYLISGRLILEIDGQPHDLAAGDSFRFHEAAYRWRNPGPAEAVAIWVIAPPVY